MRPRHHSLTAFALSAILILLVASSVAETVNYFYLVVIGVVAASVAIFTILFPTFYFFSIALANFLAVYTCVFTFIRLTAFSTLDDWVVHVGFAMPVMAFVAGSIWHRRAIRAIVQAAEAGGRPRFLRIFTSLAPLVFITSLAFFVPIYGVSHEIENALFLLKMVVASAVVLLASRYVAIFLLDAGLLFEGFFAHAGRLLLPAFAFLTFYSLIVIVFACIYRILDRFSKHGLFEILGHVEKISFPQAVYYSIATISALGTGDILPTHDIVRIVTVIEVICGVMLLMFGVSELMNYARQRENHHNEKN
ncbi:MAG: ion channel [Alphaproteobacteria bacterium]|nr:ion channel [Alphaproteobacteria bacterium]